MAWLSWQFLDPALAPKGDGAYYLGLGIMSRSEGFFRFAGNVRTYGYPAFFHLLTYAPGSGFGTEGVFRHMAAWAGGLQLLGYGAAVVWLASLIRPRDRTLAFATMAGLLLNPVAIVYAGVPMTEGPSLIASVLLVALLLKAGGAERSLLWLGIGAAVAAFAVMIRPANVALLAAWTVAALFVASTLRRMIAYSLVAAAITAAVWAPQIAYNVSHHGAASPLPMCPLADLQTGLGILNVKYATFFKDGGLQSIWYRNPFFVGEIERGAVRSWYLNHPLAGAATLAAHVFNLFDFNDLAVYPRSPLEWYGPALSFASFAAAGLAAWRAIQYGQNFVRFRKVEPTVLFVTLAWAGTVTIGAQAIVETRFGVPLAAVTGVLVADWLLRARWPSARAPLAFATAAGIVGAAISSQMAKLASPDRPYYSDMERVILSLPRGCA